MEAPAGLEPNPKLAPAAGLLRQDRLSGGVVEGEGHPPVGPVLLAPMADKKALEPIAAPEGRGPRAF
jgi:hypothetical protein